MGYFFQKHTKVNLTNKPFIAELLQSYRIAELHCTTVQGVPAILSTQCTVYPIESRVSLLRGSEGRSYEA